MDEGTARVYRQWLQFCAALPVLLRTDLAGKWVVWLDGRVRSVHATWLEASDAALEFDRASGVLVARVEEPEPEFILAASPGD